MIQVNNIRDSIAAVLEEEFPTIGIYKEAEQGFDKPCFFVAPTSGQCTRELGQRYKTAHEFVIQFYPESSVNAYGDMMGILEQLYDCLNVTAVNDVLLRNSAMRYEIKDGVLNFSVEYAFHVMKDKDQKEKMRRFLHEEHIKHE